MITLELGTLRRKNNVGNPPGKRLIESKEISVDHDKSIAQYFKKFTK